MSVSANVRNIAIILVLAGVVAFAPSGGTVANVIVQAIFLMFLGALAWVASITYRQNRTELYSLGDRRRAALYAAITALVVTLTATHRLWSTSGGSVAWLVLVGVSVYVGASVLWSARRD
ncbi:MAG: hypothetical protein WAK93_21565 [Solirubrobacteraceae bacterium]